MMITLAKPIHLGLAEKEVDYIVSSLQKHA